MNNIQLNIVANAQFQQVYAEVAKLKEAMLSLQKASVGGPFTPANTASIRQAQNAFDSAVLSTRAFTIEHVAMSSSIEKFGKQLKSGQLSLSNYYKIWRDSAKGTSAELDALATSQARLNRSIAIADPLRPGYAKLVTDINGVVTAQEKQIFYQRALNTALQQGSIKLIDFGKNTQWMGRQLTVGLTMPLAMFGAGVSNAFIQVDKELTRMQKVYGTGLVQPTQAALKQIRQDVQTLGNELARTFGTSMKETAAMAADLAATGLEGTKLLGATRQAIRLSTLGELDHQQAMQATISLQNVYKLNTQGLTQAIDFLNAVENQTSTSLQDLVDAIPRVGPIVQQLGGSFKDTAAMMVAMKEAGVPAAQGANAIKSALASLINPSKNAKEAFQQFNIDLVGISRKSGGAPIAMLKMLADQMKGLDRLAQAQLIEKLFGKFQFARIQALIDNINKAGSQTQTVFKLMGASSYDLANLAANELKQQTESASGRFKRMVETLKADLLPAGQSFLNSFTAIGNAADKVLNVFRNIAHIMGPMAGLLGKVFGGGLAGLIVVGPLIMLAGLFSNLIGNIMRGANALRMFKQGMDASAPSENKFLAGLHGMRNFYEDLDKSTIAARNQMELMPEAITSNATAFEILRKEIFLLTEQFTAFAVAQREAMGIGAIIPGKPGVRNIPFRAPGMEDGGWVPGNPSAGDVYPAMLTGKEAVIKYPNSVKHASIINAIMDDNLPGYATGKRSSMWQSGMYKAPSAIQAQTPGMSWGTLTDERMAIEAAARPILEQKYQALVDLGKITAAEAEKKVTEALANLKRVQASHLGDEKAIAQLPLSGKSISYKTWNAKDLAPDLGAINNYVDTLRKSPKIIDGFTGMLQAAGKEVPLTELEHFRQGLPPLTAKQAQLLRDISEYDALINKSYQGAAAAATLRTRAGGDYYTKLAAGELAYNPALDAKVQAQIEARLAKLDLAIVKATENVTAETMNMVSRSASDSRETKQAAKNIAGGAVNELNNPKYVQEAKSAASNIATAEVTTFAETAAAEVGLAGGAGIIGSTQTKEPVGGKSGILSKLRSSKFALGTGAMTATMLAPMLINAIPGSIGGTDITSGKTILSSLTSGASMGAMGFMSGNPAVGAVTTAIGSLVGLYQGVTQVTKDQQQKIRDQVNQQISQQSQAILSNTAGVGVAVNNLLIFAKNQVNGLSSGKPGGVSTSATQLTRQPAGGIFGWFKDAAAGVKAGIASWAGSIVGMGVGQPSLGVDVARQAVDSKVKLSPKEFKDLSNDQKAVGVGLTTVLSTISSGQVTLSQYNDMMKSIDKQTKNNKNSTAAFASTIINQGGAMGDAYKSIADKIDITSTSSSKLITILAAMSKGFDATNVASKNLFDEALKYLKESYKVAGDTGQLTGINTPADYSKQFSPLLKQYEGIKKLIDAQANAQKKYNDQLKLTQDYHTKQMDYFNQMKMAFTSGNYLQAAMIKQSATQNQAEYRANLLEQKQQDISASIQNRIAMIQEGQSSGMSLKQWLAKNKQFSTTATNDQLMKMFTGLTSSQYSTSTGAILAKSTNLQNQGDIIGAGGPFSSLTINVSADNSVVPADFAQNVAGAVTSALNTANAKNNKTNKSGASTRSGTKIKPKVTSSSYTPQVQSQLSDWGWKP